MATQTKEKIVSFRNEGSIDRGIRIVLGIVLLVLGWTGTFDGALGTVFKVLGFVPLATGLAGWCPLYALVGLSTCPIEQRKPDTVRAG